MGTSTQSPVSPLAPAEDLRVEPTGHEPQCPECKQTARWAGSPADSGFLAYCPSCDQAFHVTITADEIRLG